jgi:hypothetical protein
MFMLLALPLWVRFEVVDAACMLLSSVARPPRGPPRRAPNLPPDDMVAVMGGVAVFSSCVTDDL